MLCSSCKKKLSAHFDEAGDWRPPSGCRALEQGLRLDAWVHGHTKKTKRPRVRWVALPGKFDLPAGTNKKLIADLIKKAGVGGIAPGELLAQVRKVKGKEHLTDGDMGFYAHQLRRAGIITSVPPKKIGRSKG